MVIFIVYSDLLAVGFLVYKHLLRYDRNWILSCKLFATYGMKSMNVRTTLRF